METMELLCVMALIGFLNLVCFVIGAKVGQKVSKGETIETPKFEPFKAVREYTENKEVKKEQEKYRIIADNIDNYNGTAIGQKDIPN